MKVGTVLIILFFFFFLFLICFNFYLLRFTPLHFNKITGLCYKFTKHSRIMFQRNSFTKTVSQGQYTGNIKAYKTVIRYVNVPIATKTAAQETFQYRPILLVHEKGSSIDRYSLVHEEGSSIDRYSFDNSVNLKRKYYFNSDNC